MKEGLNKWKALLSSWIRKLNIVKMFILPKATDRFDVTLVKIPMAFFFFQKWKRLPSNLYGIAKDLSNQNHFEGGKCWEDPTFLISKLTTKIISVVVPTSG